MREKLVEYVKNLFRYAPKTQKNLDLEAEILQNSLDRFDDLVSQGVGQESAYTQAVASIGDVQQLWETGSTPQPKPKKKRTGLVAAAIILGVLLVLALLTVALAAMFGISNRGSFHAETVEEAVEDWADDLERDADHWANGIEEKVEQWVESIDEEYGYSIIAPNSTYSYSNSERFKIGAVELHGDALNVLDISWLAGKVTVEVWDGDTISVTETGAENEEEQLRWYLENSELRIAYCAAGKHTTLPAKDLTVKLPAGIAENLQRLNIIGTSQDAVVRGVTIQQEVYFCSVSGGLDLTGQAERLDLETTSGTCKLELAKTPDAVEFDSVSGSLAMTIPAGRCFEVDWETVSGEFDCDFDGKQTDDEWLFNTDENYHIRGEFDFETVSGSVEIRKS